MIDIQVDILNQIREISKGNGKPVNVNDIKCDDSDVLESILKDLYKNGYISYIINLSENSQRFAAILIKGIDFLNKIKLNSRQNSFFRYRLLWIIVAAVIGVVLGYGFDQITKDKTERIEQRLLRLELKLKYNPKMQVRSHVVPHD